MQCYPDIATAIATHTGASFDAVLTCFIGSLAEHDIDAAIEDTLIAKAKQSLTSASLWVDAAKSARDFAEDVFVAGSAPSVIDATVSSLPTITPAISLSPNMGPAGRTSRFLHGL